MRISTGPSSEGRLPHKPYPIDGSPVDQLPQPFVKEITVNYGEFHSFGSYLKILHQDSDDKPAGIVDRLGFDLLCGVAFPAPHAVEREIAAETNPPKPSLKPLSTLDRSQDLGLGCSSFSHGSSACGCRRICTAPPMLEAPRGAIALSVSRGLLLDTRSIAGDSSRAGMI